MLISYLATRVIVLPFNSLDELVEGSAFKIVLTPGSSYMDAFKKSTDSIWQEAWKTRIEPEIDSYPTSMTNVVCLPSKLQESQFCNFRFSWTHRFDHERPDLRFLRQLFLCQVCSFITPLKCSHRTINANIHRTFAQFADCEIIAIPGKYDVKPYAYGFQKDSPYLGPFNFYLKQLRERGTTKKILENYETRSQVCPDYSGRALGFDNCFTGNLTFALRKGRYVAVLYGLRF